MAKPDKFATGSHPSRGMLWAGIDPTAHHLVGRVMETRFAAFLAPFGSRGEAEAALIAAGCELRDER